MLENPFTKPENRFSASEHLIVDLKKTFNRNLADAPTKEIGSVEVANEETERSSSIYFDLAIKVEVKYSKKCKSFRRKKIDRKETGKLAKLILILQSILRIAKYLAILVWHQ